MNSTIENASVAALNPEPSTEENHQAFLADVQVNELPMNLSLYTGSHVSILCETAFRKLNNSQKTNLRPPNQKLVH